ncbi:uncharacterized protein LOC111259076 isoform X2 [Varroa jacobsoni]|uniref:uncharacterized protein LOC111259076 isoform X2 n=1 Tax=Varroa jacobsoni TaxID=62625 RepID=UPI000BF4DB26|nr:uncharacterized protein LOC111259076 isoform X2 [Varroa jacobsoni]
MGPLELVRYIIYRMAFYIWRPVLKKGRFSALYDILSFAPDKNGVIIPQKEFEEELPRQTEKEPRENYQSDSVQIFGQNAKGQILLASIQRQPDGLAIASLYVRLVCGRSYCLPQPIQVDTSNNEHFIAGSLRITCVHPMRRWRVAFNGNLKEVNAENIDLVHVRLIAIGNLAHGCADFQSYYNEKFLARQLAQKAGFRALNRDVLRKSFRSLNAYYQRFSFASKVFVEHGEPEEMYIFGYKSRFSDTNTVIKKSVIAFTEVVVLQNGISSVLGICDLPDIMDNLIFGYINLPCRQQRPLEFCSPVGEFFEPGKLSVEIGADCFKSFRLAVLEVTDVIDEVQRFQGSYWKRSSKFCKISLDGNVGHALTSDFTREKIQLSLPVVPRYLPLSQASPSLRPLVLPFQELACVHSPLTGGKGSSLAVLTQISLDHTGLFHVPQGVCVTTVAYEEFVSTQVVANALKDLEEIVASNPTLKDLREACNRIGSIVATADLLPSISSVLLENIKPSLRYAVRSSACGEDSEETSAAGQMETILGVEGPQQVLQAVTRCWASQFSFTAVQYRRRYGQPVNVPMCVVVQEMISSEISGVMFTVDPVSGNPRHITITANYGIGESVVSAAADPDTFVVAKTHDSQKVEFVCEKLGEKRLSTVLSDTGGTRNITGETRSSEACLSREQVLRLGKVALVLEQAYAAPRDTEWAFFKDILYMLQARPITSLDQIDTEFEYLHESDQGFDSEIDTLSKANVGEVFGGSMSTLGLDVIDKALVHNRIAAQDLNGEKQHTYAKAMFLSNCYSQCFFPTYWPGFSDYPGDDLLSLGLAISMAGRRIEDECVLISNRNKKRYQFAGRAPRGFLKALRSCWYAEDSLKQTKKMLATYKAKTDVDRFTESRQLFNYILNEIRIFQTAMLSHENFIMYNSISNVAILSLLVYYNNGEWDQNVYSDFAALTASCQEFVESAGVPTSMACLAQQVEKQFGEEFKKLSFEDADKTLRDDRGEAGRLFNKFLDEHGHRCMRELDIQAKSWSMDSTLLIKSLQAMVGSIRTSSEKKKVLTHDELINTLNIRLPKICRFILKFILRRTQKGIARRETGKSLLVMSNDFLRKYFYRLGRMMVKDGRLPEEDLIFHLTLSEIHELFETRAPKYLIRARHRRTNQKAAAIAIFPEHCIGRPIQCLNAARGELPVKMAAGTLMRGTPVCAGQVTAPVRVVCALEDAGQIQKGDVLITYAIDIGWSPYFPLLAGIATELGGAISHGAVVAREYSLPSIVGVHGATQAFQSGQIVVLDGLKGTIGLVAD